MTSRSKDDASALRVLGRQTKIDLDKGPDAAILETFPNQYPQRNYIISLAFPEFTSLCPVTGQPDFGVICVDYIPDLLCLESKSFKLYMFAYRNHGSFMETIVNSILEDVTTTIQPRWCGIKGLFAPRGGVGIHVFAEHYKEMKDESDRKTREAITSWRLQAAPEKY